MFSRRKISRSVSYDNHGIEEEKLQSAIRPNRLIYPSDRDLIVPNKMLPTLSKRVEKSKDSNFAWID